MAQTNLQLPQIVIANTTPGTDWLNPNNILLADGDFAISAGSSQILTVGNFPLNLVQGDSVTNIIVAVKGYRGSFNTTLQIFAIDDTTGIEYSYPMLPAFQGFDGVNTLYSMPATLFGTTWTVDQVNNIKIRLIADGELYLDYVQVNVIYTPVSTLPAPVSPTTGETVCDEFVQAIKFQLAQSLTSSSLFAFLESFNYPDGTPIAFADFHGDEALLTIDQGVPGKEENVRITAVEQNYQGTGLCRLSFGTLNNRGLAFKWPYTTDVNLRQDHSGTAEVVISNSAPFYDRFLKKCQIDALVSAPINVEQEEVDVVNPIHTINFKGSGVSVVQNGTDPYQADVTIAGAGTGNPVPDATSSETSGSVQVPDLTWSHTVSGVNRFLVVQVSMEAGKTVTGITYNGIAMSLSIAIEGATTRSETWYLVAPSLGTHDIVVTFSADSYCCAGAESWANVDQTTPIGDTSSATGTSLAPSVVVNTLYDNSVVTDGLSTAATPIVYTVGAGQVENWHHTANTDTRQGASSYELAGSAPDVVTMSYAITQNTEWSITAVEIKGITSVVSPLEVEDEGISVETNVTKINFVGAGVTASNPSPNEVEVNIPGGVASDEKVKATVADTTPGYLDPKINIHSSDSSVTINKTITNPGGNEVVDYDLLVALGGGGGGTKIAIDTTQTVVGSSSTSNLFSPINIPGGTLGTNNAIRFKILLSNIEVDNAKNIDVNVKYGGVTLATATFDGGTDNINPCDGYIEGLIVADNATNAQKVIVTNIAIVDGSNPGNIPVISNYGTGAIDSTIDQDFVIEVSTGAGATTITSEGVIVEKITSASGQFTVNTDESVTDWITNQVVPFGDTLWTLSGTAVSPRGSGAYLYSTGGVMTAVLSTILPPASLGGAGALQWIDAKTFRIKLFGTIQNNPSIAVPDDSTGFGFFAGSLTGGTQHIGDPTGTVGERISFGINNNTLYAITDDGVAITTTNLGAYTATEDHSYVIQVNGTTSVNFYLDGTLVATHTTNLPTSANDIDFAIAGSDSDSFTVGGSFSDLVISKKIN